MCACDLSQRCSRDSAGCRRQRNCSVCRDCQRAFLKDNMESTWKAHQRCKIGQEAHVRFGSVFHFVREMTHARRPRIFFFGAMAKAFLWLTMTRSCLLRSGRPVGVELSSGRISRTIFSLRYFGAGILRAVENVPHNLDVASTERPTAHQWHQATTCRDDVWEFLACVGIAANEAGRCRNFL